MLGELNIQTFKLGGGGDVAQQTSAQDASAENGVENEETRHGLDE